MSGNTPLYIVMGYYHNCSLPAANILSFIHTHDYKEAESVLLELLVNNSRPTQVSNSYYCKDGCFWIKTIMLDMKYENGKNLCVPDPLEKDST